MQARRARALVSGGVLLFFLAACGAMASLEGPKAPQRGAVPTVSRGGRLKGAAVSRARPSKSNAAPGAIRGARLIANTTRPRARQQQQCHFAEGCAALATQVRFGMPGEEGRFCSEHKQAAHRNLNNYRAQAICQHIGGCDRLGTFGVNSSALAASRAGTGDAEAASPGSRRALFCKAHKQPDHVDIRNKLCWSPGCARRALYGILEGDAGARSCQRHRKAGERTLGSPSRRCMGTDCSRVATFGSPAFSPGEGSGKPLWCVKHKNAGDVDMRNRQCEAQMTGWDVERHQAASFRCPHRASFGNPAEGLLRFCSAHRGRWDSNLNNKKRCQMEDCQRTPSFCNPETRRPQFCGRHRPEGFVHSSALGSTVTINSHQWVPDHLWHKSSLSHPRDGDVRLAELG